MDHSDAASLAIDLMEAHGLIKDGPLGGIVSWDFEFDRAKRRFGLCNHTKRKISLSKYLVALNDVEQVRDVILHEIAHALVGPGHGHNRVWKAKCREIGAVPKRCYRTVHQGGDVVPPKYNYQTYCKNCKNKGRKTYRKRHKLHHYHCSLCKGELGQRKLPKRDVKVA